MTQTTHHFESTQAAYDACQCDDSVKDGDILVILTERVVGVADTWPIAITDAEGELHKVRANHWDAVADRLGRANLIAASKLAYALGYELNPDAASLV